MNSTYYTDIPIGREMMRVEKEDRDSDGEINKRELKRERWEER